MDKELMKGNIDILLLSLIAKRAMYGYEIVQTIKAKSEDMYEMSEGTLYPALKRMEYRGHLESFWGDSGTGGRRKYYRITDRGLEELSKKLAEWDKVQKLINRCREGMAWMNSGNTSTPLCGDLA